MQFECQIGHCNLPSITSKNKEFYDSFPPDSILKEDGIERICSAYMKLLFPHIRSAEDMSPFEFDSFCLQPALEMRSIIRVQMGLIDIKEAGKTVPDIRTKGL